MMDALVGHEPSAELLALLSEEDLHAPALIDFEVASALRGHVRAGKLTAARLTGAIEDFAALQLQRHYMTKLLRHILRLRANFTAYDAAYVVLAQALDAPLVTADVKMQEAQRLGVEVRVLR